MSRQTKQGDEARQKIKAGIDRAANIVKVTLGAKGRNVVLDTHPYGNPINTNDGVTILRELVFEDRFENIGAKIIKEAAGRTNDVAGDGTTTASVLLQAIVNEGSKAIISGADPVAVRRGITRAANNIISYLKQESVKAKGLEELVATATISCGDSELGQLVAGVVSKAGLDGVVTLEDNPEPETVSERTEGLKLRGGFTIPNFVNVPELQQAAFNDIPIFVTNQSITLADEMAAIMNCAYKKNKKAVVIIAQSVEADAMITALKNYLSNKFYALPIRVLAYGDMGEGVLRDVAAVTGARFFDSMANDKITDASPDDLGMAKKVVATKNETTIATESEDGKVKRIKELEGQLKSLDTDREFERESIRERIAKLNNALFTIKVGGLTDTERQERKLRVEDAINATKAAISDGIVAGGGSALYRASMKVGVEGADDELLGFSAVLKACQVPLEQMAVNSAIRLDRSDLVAIEKKNKAIDFTCGCIVNAFEKGIIDPAKVVISALENAASGAALFLITEAAVVLEEEQKEEQL